MSRHAGFTAPRSAGTCTVHGDPTPTRGELTIEVSSVAQVPSPVVDSERARRPPDERRERGRRPRPLDGREGCCRPREF